MPTPSNQDAFLLPASLAVCAAGLFGVALVIHAVGDDLDRVRQEPSVIHLPTPEERMREPGMAARGAALFEQNLCISCHGKFLEGAAGPCLTDAVWLKGSSFADIRKSINEGSSEKGMPAFDKLISEDDKIALIAFIKSRAQGLRKVNYAFYEGNWKKLPDFASLKPVAAGMLRDDEPVSLAKFGKPSDCGAVWTGELVVPATGEYSFHMASKGGSALFVDGAPVVLGDGIHDDRRTFGGAATLKAGTHRFELRYFQSGAGRALRLTWDGPASTGFLTEPAAAPNLLLAGKGAIVSRGNFKGETSARMLAMGFPGRINCAYDADHGTLPAAWHGEFLDVAGSREERGTGFNHPPEDKVIPLAAAPLVRLADHPEAIPSFLGYRAVGDHVTLFLELDGVRFEQTLAPTAAGLEVTVVFPAPPTAALLIGNGAQARRVSGPDAARVTFLLPF